MFHRFLFYCGPVNENPELISLRDEEHHHLSQVVRMQRGQEAWATDGEGRIFSCSVEKIEKNETILRVTSVTDKRQTSGELVLGLACIKKDRFEKALSMCSEIGITRCVPIAYDNSLMKSFSDSTLLRFRRIVLEAMKQSFGAVLPKVEEVEDFDSFMGKTRKDSRIIAGAQFGGSLEAVGKSEKVVIIVGPEAGFSIREVEILKNVGCSFVCVSENRLRSETAMVSLTALVSILRDSR